jgi:hypothetical protein
MEEYVSLRTTPSPLIPCLFLNQQNRPLFKARLIIPFLSAIGSLACVLEPMAVHSVLRAIQRELTCCLPFLSCFLHNPTFRQADFCICYLFHAGFLLDLIFEPEDGDSMLLRKVSVDFQRSTRRYIPEDRNLHYFKLRNKR